MPRYKNYSDTVRVVVTDDGPLSIGPSQISKDVTLVDGHRSNVSLLRDGDVKPVKAKKKGAD